MALPSAPLQELVRWRLREREVEAALRDVEAEEVRLSEELGKVDAQAGYYDSLAGDMKKDVQPPSLSGLIRSLRW
jgi:hypothetical protein